MSAAGGEPLEGAGEAAGASAQEQELRAAYEEQLRRITSLELLLQAAASLLNLGARRMGMGEEGRAERDLEQVRDAIDGVRGLMPVIERRSSPAEMGPLRDALSHLQVAYAREAQAAAAGRQEGAPGAGEAEAGGDGGAGHEDAGGEAEGGQTPGGGSAERSSGASGGGPGESADDGGPEAQEGAGAAPAEPGDAAAQGRSGGASERPAPAEQGPRESRRPGPAEASGRLWVPGKD